MISADEASAVTGFLYKVLNAAKLIDSDGWKSKAELSIELSREQINNLCQFISKIEGLDFYPTEAEDEKRRQEEEQAEAKRTLAAIQEAFPGASDSSWGNDERIFSCIVGRSKVWYPYRDLTGFVVQVDTSTDQQEGWHEFATLEEAIIFLKRYRKEFFVRDNSGRGNHYTTTGDKMIEPTDADERDDEEEEDEDSLNYFIDNAEIGDEFENDDDNSTVTRTK